MKQRIYSLDMLRGFSLLGIVIMNIVAFSHDTFDMNPYYLFRNGLDQLLYSLDTIFVHNSFYPIFAMLFGYGFAIMKDSAAKRGRNFVPIAYRRLIAMLIFGTLHGAFLFSGDILQSYAIVGLLFVPFLYIDKIFSLLGALIGWCYYFFMYILPFIINGLQNPNYDYRGSYPGNASAVAEVFNSHNIIEIFALTRQFFFKYFFVTDFNDLMFRVSSLLPMMLIGAYMHRSGTFQKITAHKEWFYPLAAVLMVLGIMIKSLPIIFWGRMSFDETCVYIGGIILAASYVIFIVLLSESATFRKYTRPISELGKMSFTVYIMESVLMFCIIYGFALYGELNLLTTYAIGIMIYLILLLASHLYFKRYNQGPLEALWRKITYWSWRG